MVKEVSQNTGNQEPKAVMMPSRAETLLKLQGVGVYGVTPQTDRFYDSFIDYVSGHEIVGVGVGVTVGTGVGVGVGVSVGVGVGVGLGVGVGVEVGAGASRSVTTMLSK